MAKYESNINGENYIATPSQALREALAKLITEEKSYAQYNAKDKESYEAQVELRHFDTMISQYEEAIRVLEDKYRPQIFIPKDNKEEN
ncbi:hypothetical protein F867_gp032 [Staphylococcus phage JD007]|uniref:Uncharacterized protein n=2 Tax=Kayvirus TaxID=1857843 RepID=V5XWU2_BPS25|nr:hypothetical protein F867_gp032 [Staphylococcus phage JD007]YP_008854318.1 hypothetical protein X600_gp023 [Staphylococcus phage S25-3]AFV50826.1 hypothetical protein [Staphylococcus phage JD007]BAO09346.1 hypothetical protein [Staphylococcus phage S25-3]VEV88799.1 hypothetical protein [Staphylococcus phage Stab21]